MEGSSDIRREVSASDVFVHCIDKPREALYWSNTVSLELGIPWLFGAYTGPMLVVGTFIPGKTGCYQCITDSQERKDRANGTMEIATRRRARDNPVLAPTAQISGNLAAMETINYLLGMNVQTAGRILHHNFLDYEHHYYIDAGYSSECPHRVMANH
jgi:molybdopterin/thiamine biosynthesis adenylyltransferase